MIINPTNKIKKMIQSIQYFKLNRPKWLKGRGIDEQRLRIAVAECNYKKLDRQLKEQFLHGLNDNDMLTEIIYKLTTMTYINTVTSKEILA